MRDGQGWGWGEGRGRGLCFGGRGGLHMDVPEIVSMSMGDEEGCTDKMKKGVKGEHPKEFSGMHCLLSAITYHRDTGGAGAASVTSLFLTAPCFPPLSFLGVLETAACLPAPNKFGT